MDANSCLTHLRVKFWVTVMNRSPTSQTCHQHIWSPTSVTNIEFDLPSSQGRFRSICGSGAKFQLNGIPMNKCEFLFDIPSLPTQSVTHPGRCTVCGPSYGPNYGVRFIISFCYRFFKEISNKKRQLNISQIPLLNGI